MSDEHAEDRMAAAMEEMQQTLARSQAGPLPDYRMKALDFTLASFGWQQGLTAEMDDARIIERAQAFYDWLVA